MSIWVVATWDVYIYKSDLTLLKEVLPQLKSKKNTFQYLLV